MCFGSGEGEEVKGLCRSRRECGFVYKVEAVMGRGRLCGLCR